MASGLVNRLGDRDPKRRPDRVGFWPGATAEQVEFRTMVAFKAFSWLIGEDWRERWAGARAELNRHDVGDAKLLAVEWAGRLAWNLGRRGLSFGTLMDDRQELMKFWKAMHGNRGLSRPSDNDLALISTRNRLLGGIGRKLKGPWKGMSHDANLGHLDEMEGYVQESPDHPFLPR